MLKFFLGPVCKVWWPAPCMVVALLLSMLAAGQAQAFEEHVLRSDQRKNLEAWIRRQDPSGARQVFDGQANGQPVVVVRLNRHRVFLDWSFSIRRTTHAAAAAAISRCEGRLERPEQSCAVVYTGSGWVGE